MSLAKSQFPRHTKHTGHTEAPGLWARPSAQPDPKLRSDCVERGGRDDGPKKRGVVHLAASLLLVAMPFVTCGVLVPSSKARSP